MNDLIETIDLMKSDDYKKRFVAEYWQTKIRYDKLYNMVGKYESGTLEFTPSCNIAVFKKQLHYMKKYLNILERRAKIEGVTLYF